MEPVDGVAPVHHSRADEEHVVGGFGRQGSERGGDHRRGVAAQDAAPADIVGVARVAADRVRRAGHLAPQPEGSPEVAGYLGHAERPTNP
jgi:hypothetical protein